MKARQIIESNEKLKSFLTRHSIGYSKPGMMLRNLGFYHTSHPSPTWYQLIHPINNNDISSLLLKIPETGALTKRSGMSITMTCGNHQFHKYFTFRPERVTYEDFAPWFQDFVMSLKNSTSPAEYTSAFNRLEHKYQELHQERGQADLGFPEI